MNIDGDRDRFFYCYSVFMTATCKMHYVLLDLNLCHFDFCYFAFNSFIEFKFFFLRNGNHMLSEI